MQFFLVTSLLFFSSLTSLAKGFVCRPHPRETQLSISWNEKEVSVNVQNPMGYSYMPQMESVGEASISFLKMQTADLKALDQSFTYRWPIDKCDLSRASEKLITCNGRTQSDRQTQISALGFTTAKLKEESLSGSQETLRLRLSVNVDQGNIYFVTIPFPTSRCF